MSRSPHCDADPYGIDSQGHTVGTGAPQHVRQKDSGGCVVASLAMACGMTYEQVRAEIVNFDERNSANHRDTEAFLAAHGFAWQQRWRYGPPENTERTPWPPEPWADVHLVNVTMPSRNSHQVVMLRDGSVLDPLCDERKWLTDYPEVNSVTAIYKLPLVALSERGRIEMPSQGEILLACGELKASELRAVKAVLAWFIGRLNG